MVVGVRFSGRSGWLRWVTVVAWLSGCSPSPPAPAVPAFAATLPGHTVAVVWGDAAAGAPIDVPPPITSWLGVTAYASPGSVQAWVGEGLVVGWPNLAGSALFAAACAETLPGSRRLFVDLQQMVDLLVAATRESQGGESPWSTLQGVFVQRALDAFAVRGLQWLVAGERSEGERRTWEAVVASTQARRGVFGVLAVQNQGPVRLSAPADAEVVGTAAFVPSVSVAIVRDLLSGGEDGPLQMARELLRGPRFDAGLAALQALGGRIDFAAGVDYGWVRLNLADASAVADALDVIGAPARGGWDIGGWHVVVAGKNLTARRGMVPPAAQELSSPQSVVWVVAPTRGIEVVVQRSNMAERVRITAQYGRR